MLTRLNDNHMHPNPDFAYRDSTQVDQGNDVLLRIELFDIDPGMHEAHLVAYLNLVAVLVEESCKLVVDLLGSGDPQDGLNSYDKTRFASLLQRQGFEERFLQEIREVQDREALSSHGWLWLIGWAKSRSVELPTGLLVDLFEQWSDVFVKTSADNS